MCTRRVNLKILTRAKRNPLRRRHKSKMCGKGIERNVFNVCELGKLDLRQEESTTVELEEVGLRKENLLRLDAKLPHLGLEELDLLAAAAEQPPYHVVEHRPFHGPHRGPRHHHLRATQLPTVPNSKRVRRVSLRLFLRFESRLSLSLSKRTKWGLKRGKTESFETFATETRREEKWEGLSFLQGKKASFKSASMPHIRQM
ncbi:hypothetical protein GW17_00043411 [Ensete ventricosum]|nr:hypothetical protein GW17_00043411 [Ensete ventricosum]